MRMQNWELWADHLGRMFGGSEGVAGDVEAIVDLEGNSVWR